MKGKTCHVQLNPRGFTRRAQTTLAKDIDTDVLWQMLGQLEFFIDDPKLDVASQHCYIADDHFRALGIRVGQAVPYRRTASPMGTSSLFSPLRLP